MKRIAFFILLMLSVSGIALAQEYITLSGKVSDKQGRQPVPFATIMLQGTSTGTQAGDRGQYTLKVPSTEGTVVFSALGYRKLTVSVAQLRKNGDVRLEPHALQLKEVTVKDYRTPQALIAEAVSRIPLNYHTDTTVGTWFARDWRMLDTTLYLFDESVVDMLRYGYASHTGKRYYTASNRRREMDDNYKAVRKHRLLVYDSVPLRLAASGEDAAKSLQYSDNSAFYDILSTPDANYLTAPRLVKRHRFDPIQEYTDDQGETFYLLQATSRDGHTHYTWRIRKADLAIVELSGHTDTSTTTIKPGLWAVLPYSAVRDNGGRFSYRYALRDGRYTLVAFAAYSDRTCFSHRTYGHEHDAPEQHFVSSREWLLTDLQRGDTTFLEHNAVQGHRPVGMDTAFGQSTFDEAYWEQYNTFPLAADIQARLQAQLAAQASGSAEAVAQPVVPTARQSQLDSLNALRAATPMTMPDRPRWAFYRYGGIGGNRLYCSDGKSRRGFSQQLGIGTRLYLGGRFHLRADLQYAWLTTKTTEGRFSTHNLTLPLRVDFDLLRESPDIPMRFYLTAGAWGRYALLGRLGSDWHTLGRDFDRPDYGWSWGIGMEFLRNFFLEWTSFRSVHPLPLDNAAPEMRRHNGAFTIGVNF